MSRSFKNSLPPILLLGVFLGGAYWLATRPGSDRGAADAAGKGSAAGQPAARLNPVYTVATDARRVLPATAPDGHVRPVPALPSLDEALGLESKLAYERRLQVIHALGAGMPPAQLDHLLAFVAERRSPSGLSIEQVRALKNDVLNVLVAQKGDQAALTALLQGIHDDATQDPGLRDYALQHLANLQSVAGHAPQWQAVAGSDSGLAATALRQLHLSAREGGLTSEERTRLAQSAAQLAADASQPETSRATALLICGDLKVPDASPVAYALARSEQTSFPLRIAAIATLGQVGGDPATRDYLQQLTTGPEKRLRVPATVALKKLSIN